MNLIIIKQPPMRYLLAPTYVAAFVCILLYFTETPIWATPLLPGNKIAGYAF